MLVRRSSKAVHPLGNVHSHYRGGLTVAESGAIIEYLVDTTAMADWRPSVATLNRCAIPNWCIKREGSGNGYQALPSWCSTGVDNGAEPFSSSPCKGIAASSRASSLNQQIVPAPRLTEQRTGRPGLVLPGRVHAAMSDELSIGSAAARGGWMKMPT